MRVRRWLAYVPRICRRRGGEGPGRVIIAMVSMLPQGESVVGGIYRREHVSQRKCETCCRVGRVRMCICAVWLGMSNGLAVCRRWTVYRIRDARGVGVWVYIEETVHETSVWEGYEEGPLMV